LKGILNIPNLRLIRYLTDACEKDSLPCLYCCSCIIFEEHSLGQVRPVVFDCNLHRFPKVSCGCLAKLEQGTASGHLVSKADGISDSGPGASADCGFTADRISVSCLSVSSTRHRILNCFNLGITFSPNILSFPFVRFRISTGACCGSTTARSLHSPLSYT